MFLIALGIPGTFGFADYKSRGRRGSVSDPHFGCIINLLSFININLFININNDFIIKYY